MNCSSCRYHKAEGSTLFGACTYFEQKGKEVKDITDGAIYENGCRFFLDKMVCFECNNEVTFDDSEPASAVRGDMDRCCKPCLDKIIQDTIKSVKGIRGIVKVTNDIKE